MERSLILPPPSRHAGDPIGFTRDTLQQLNSKNALRLIKKTNLFKTTIKRESDLSSHLSLIRPISAVSSSQSMSPNSSATLASADVSSEALEQQEWMRKMILQESALWTRELDSLLIEV